MNRSNYDSEFCGSLPIQLINLIQPYGVLLVIRKSDRTIIQVSENASEIFEIPFKDIVNRKLEEFLTADAYQQFGEYRTAKDKIPQVWRINNRSYLALIHYQADYLIVELDLMPYDESKQLSFVSVYQEIKVAMSLIQDAKTVQEVTNVTASELKRISGFDKVMVYCFDRDWNGTVLAEEMESGMESYIGFTFPASDVPQQARMLYQRNAFRFIPTRDYLPVKLYPVLNPVTQSFIDLSDCNLRSVAAVHLEYLKNMGIMSSMSTRILSGDTLWGLIACHHRTPKILSFEMRSVFELLSNIISSRITSLQNNELHESRMRVKEQYKDMVEEAYRHGNARLHTALLEGHSDLLTLFNAQGVAVTLHGRTYFKGKTPDRERLDELVLWLHALELKSVFHTDCLSAEYDQSRDYLDIASGIMVIPVDAHQDDYVILFREEVVRTINWGGNPEERIQFEEGTRNYHPRNSFQKWQQKVTGTSLPWHPEEISAAENLRSFIYEFLNKGGI
jgi:chemotaxis family two-component system sensor kinase Cph1